MANNDPTGGGEAVALSVPPAYAEYLRRELSGFIACLECDLDRFPDHPRAGCWRSYIDAYGRLLDGLAAGEIIPDAEVRSLIREWADGSDREGEYERVAFEHAALLSLGEQIGAGR